MTPDEERAQSSRGRGKAASESKTKLNVLRLVLGLPIGLAVGVIVFFAVTFLSSDLEIIYGTLISLGASVEVASFASLLPAIFLGLLLGIAITLFLPEYILDERAKSAAAEAYALARRDPPPGPGAPDS